MTDGSWDRQFEVFDAILETPESARAARLERECGGDEDLRRRVEELLEEHRRAGGLLDRPGDLAEWVADTPWSARWIGCRIGAFRLESILGEGGMGVVFAARQDSPYDRDVALKLIKPGLDSEPIVRRFEAERRTLAALEHPNVCRIFDGGATEDGRPYFVMERVDGDSIVEWCDARRLPIAARLRIFDEACAGVLHAHRRGILHRDLKPSNLLVCESDDGPTVKVIDFGIARAIDATGGAPKHPSTRLTRRGAWVGTPEYMSPERVGADEADLRSDVYSLGAVLYELLTGRLPLESESFRGADSGEIRRILEEVEPTAPSARVVGGDDGRAHARDRCTEPGELRRALSGELDWIVLKALSKEPDRRYESVADLREDLRRARENRPVLAGPPSALYRVRKWIRRHRLAFSAGLAVTVLVVGSAVATAVQSVRLASALEEAQQRRSEAVEQRAEARRQQRSAEAVSEFLVGVFASGDPERTGIDVTARELLELGLERLDGDLADEPRVRGEILSTVGMVYRDSGDLKRAEELLRRALETQRGLAPEGDAATATTLGRLGMLQLFAEDFEAAKTSLREELEIHRRLGSDVGRATSNYRLGTLLSRIGAFDEAEERLLAAADLLRSPDVARHSDPEIGGAASIDEQLGVLHHRRGDYDSAVRFYRRASERIARGDPERERIEPALANLGALLLDRGEIEPARELLEEVLEMRRRRLGPRHYRVAAVLNNLALLHHRVGDLDRAAERFREALGMNREAYGPRHTAVATNLNNLALVLRDRGDLDGAERLFRECLDIQREVLGRDHVSTAFPLTNLGRIDHLRGDVRRAEVAYREALELRRAALPEDHPASASTLLWLGLLTAESGRADEGEPMVRRALEIRRAKFDAGDGRIAEAESALGSILVATGEEEAGGALLRRGYEALLNARGPNAPPTLEAARRLDAAGLDRDSDGAAGTP